MSARIAVLVSQEGRSCSGEGGVVSTGSGLRNCLPRCTYVLLNIKSISRCISFVSIDQMVIINGQYRGPWVQLLLKRQRKVKIGHFCNSPLLTNVELRSRLIAYRHRFLLYTNEKVYASSWEDNILTNSNRVCRVIISVVYFTGTILYLLFINVHT